MPTTNSAAGTILLAGFVAGCCDITAALIVYCTMVPMTPMRLLQGIAAGILGRQAAYAGGAKTAALGFVCHFVIALGAAAVYLALSRALPFLNHSIVLSAAIWGTVVYFFMQYVTLPLSRIGMPRFNLKFTIIGLIIHFFCIGLPIAAITRRYR
ncbi:MAG TPA: hypothetical protein VGJ06_08685 [Candidatus Acidoferrum sp.]|jgi:uncharacterized membrane protein YagU involved in acid resistance